MRKLGEVLAIAGICLGLTELGAGYLLSRSNLKEDLALWQLLKPILNPSKTSSEELIQKLRVSERRENLFVTYDRSSGFKLHPFVDYTGVHGIPKIRHNIHLDYFGYRNRTNLYFEKNSDKLVVLTGGSEAAGHTHQTTIAEHLERILNEQSDYSFKVLNLSMNGYTISNEINAYIHFAYALRPDWVLSHSGFNDLYWGMSVPQPFKRLGLIYLPRVESWLQPLYSGDWAVRSEDIIDTQHADQMVKAIVANLKKYKKLVETNGGQFLWGLQKYRKLMKEPWKQKRQNVLGWFYKKMSVQLGALQPISFQDNPNIEILDECHSSEYSSLVIAKIYANSILGHATVARKKH